VNRGNLQICTRNLLCYFKLVIYLLSEDVWLCRCIWCQTMGRFTASVGLICAQQSLGADLHSLNKLGELVAMLVPWWQHHKQCGAIIVIIFVFTIHVIIIIIARDSIYAKRAYAIAIPSVCPSVVCLSHGWISQKRLKLGSCNFHHTVAPSL